MFLESYFEVLGVSNTLLELLSVLASIVLLFIVLIGGSGWAGYHLVYCIYHLQVHSG